MIFTYASAFTLKALAVSEIDLMSTVLQSINKVYNRLVSFLLTSCSTLSIGPFESRIFDMITRREFAFQRFFQRFSQNASRFIGILHVGHAGNTPKRSSFCWAHCQ